MIKATGTDLRPIPWTPEPITALPEVHEGNTDFDWRLWDAAIDQLEADTPDGRAKRLAQSICRPR